MSGTATTVLGTAKVLEQAILLVVLCDHSRWRSSRYLPQDYSYGCMCGGTIIEATFASLPYDTLIGWQRKHGNISIASFKLTKVSGLYQKITLVMFLISCPLDFVVSG